MFDRSVALSILMLSVGFTENPLWAQSKSILDCSSHEISETTKILRNALQAKGQITDAKPTPPEDSSLVNVDGHYWWKLKGEDALSFDELPYGVHFVGDTVNRWGRPQLPFHRSRQVFKAYRPSSLPEGVQALQEDAGYGRSLPVFAYRKFSLYKDSSGNILLADHADESLHPLWTKIQTSGENKTGAVALNQDFSYDHVTDTIWSASYLVSAPDVFDLEKKISIDGAALGQFELPREEDYASAEQRGIRHSLEDFASAEQDVVRSRPRMILNSFGPHSKNPHWMLRTGSKPKDALGEFLNHIAKHDDLLRFHGASGYKSGTAFTPQSDERLIARYILRLQDLSPEEASQIRSRYGLQASHDDKAQSWQERANDENAILLLKTKK